MEIPAITHPDSSGGLDSLVTSEVLSRPYVRILLHTCVQLGEDFRHRTHDPGSLNPFLDDRRAVDLGADQKMLGTLSAHGLGNPLLAFYNSSTRITLIFSNRCHVLSLVIM